VTADLGKWNLKSPMADEGLKIKVGAEYRSESAVFSPDLASETLPSREPSIPWGDSSLPV
jgi:hypothetical protein